MLSNWIHFKKSDSPSKSSPDTNIATVSKSSQKIDNVRSSSSREINFSLASSSKSNQPLPDFVNGSGHVVTDSSKNGNNKYHSEITENKDQEASHGIDYSKYRASTNLSQNATRKNPGKNSNRISSQFSPVTPQASPVATDQITPTKKSVSTRISSMSFLRFSGIRKQETTAEPLISLQCTYPEDNDDIDEVFQAMPEISDDCHVHVQAARCFRLKDVEIETLYREKIKTCKSRDETILRQKDAIIRLQNCLCSLYLDKKMFYKECVEIEDRYQDMLRKAYIMLREANRNRHNTNRKLHLVEMDSAIKVQALVRKHSILEKKASELSLTSRKRLEEENNLNNLNSLRGGNQQFTSSKGRADHGTPMSPQLLLQMSLSEDEYDEEVEVIYSADSTPSPPLTTRHRHHSSITTTTTTTTTGTQTIVIDTSKLLEDSHSNSTSTSKTITTTPTPTPAPSINNGMSDILNNYYDDQDLSQLELQLSRAEGLALLLTQFQKQILSTVPESPSGYSIDMITITAVDSLKLIHLERNIRDLLAETKV